MTSRCSPSALIKDFPEYYPMFSEPEFTFNKTRQYNRNPLLRELRRVRMA